MDKLNMHTPNFTDENIAKLADLFPGCVTESRDNSGNLKKSIDFDLLKQELSHNIVDGPKERYQLNWPGKKEALLTANAPIAKTLRPVREESVDFDTTQNLFIEGDNLDALKLLQSSYLGQIKLIFIDPPYNRGDDLIYQDAFAEGIDDFMFQTNQIDDHGNKLVSNTEYDGRFHSKWLSLMYMRLKISRNLLNDNGVIFISIGDHEVYNLLSLCHEIFGRQNYLGIILWKKKTNGNNVGYIPPVHDYILCFAKNANENCLRGFPLSEEYIQDSYSNPDNDPRGPWTTSDLSANHEGPIFEITNPNTGKKYLPAKGRYWVFNENEVKKRIADGRIIFGKTGNAGPIQKKFLKERDNLRMKAESWWDNHGFNSEGTIELGNLFEPKIFDHPKPTSLMKNLIDIASSEHDIIMDFFAGSGSTAHAVMDQNSHDDSMRKFILIQYPEEIEKGAIANKNYGFAHISDLTKERIRRAGKKIKDETGKDIDTGFRVLKIDSSNMKDIYYSPDATSQEHLDMFADNIKEDRSSEDLLFQVLLDWGVDLTLPIVREEVAGQEVFFVDGNALAACFVSDGGADEDFCKELAKREPLVVFRDSGFASDSVKINVEQIFKLMSPNTDIRTI